MQDGEVSVSVYIKDESLWVTQKAMSELFDVDESGINRHLKKIFSTGELDEKVVVAKIATITQHGAIKGKHRHLRLRNIWKYDRATDKRRSIEIH